jgi:soluble lytic murein transglycosylase-like protein
MLRSLVAAAALLAMTPVVASAQIYSWRDASGRLVLSDQPKDPSAKTYYVPSSSTAATATQFATTKASVGEQANRYDDLINQHAAEHSLSADFVRAVIQAESAFNPWAKSAKGAMGLMQLMPSTAAAYGVLNAYNPADNIRAGVAYLKSLLTRFNNNESLALAAYNAGPGAVEKYGNTVPPYKETRAYVKRIEGTQAAAIAAKHHIYRVATLVDGKTVVRFTDKAEPGATIVQ